MRDTQDKVLAQIEQAAKDYGYEVVNDHLYGNTGEIRIEAPASFEPVLRFTYQFQTGYFSLARVNPHLTEFPLAPDGTQLISVNFNNTNDTSVKAADVIKAIRNHLARIRQDAVKAELEELTR